MGGGSFQRIPYPKYVWSPAGGWYCQPVNWKANTAIASMVIFGIVVMVGELSVSRETYAREPRPNEDMPSKYFALSYWLRKPSDKPFERGV